MGQTLPIIGAAHPVSSPAEKRDFSFLRRVIGPSGNAVAGGIAAPPAARDSSATRRGADSHPQSDSPTQRCGAPHDARTRSIVHRTAVLLAAWLTAAAPSAAATPSAPSAITVTAATRATAASPAPSAAAGVAAAASVARRIPRAAAPTAVQHPATLLGRVTDAATGAPLEGAHIELDGVDQATSTDASGSFRFRALEPGRYTVRVTRLGYRTLTTTVELANGRTTRLDLALDAEALPIAAIDVVAPDTRRGQQPGATTLTRADIERSGARTAGELIRAVPGVTVRSTTTGGPETVSIRGSSAGAVLVLLDGVAINDPVTGEADLSGVRASAIESVTVLPGARSSRYGPRAEAGVILIETRQPGGERTLSTAVGSLGGRSAALEWGGVSPAWGAGVAWRTADGSFDYAIPSDVGGGRARRQNADVESLDAWAGASFDVLGAPLRVRGGVERMERGLPGRSFAPSPQARQTLDRARASLSWRHADARNALSISLAGVRDALRFRDPAPPFGLPYDDTAQVRAIELRASAQRRPERTLLDDVGVGVEARWQHIRATSLSSDAPERRLDLGVYAHAGTETSARGIALSFGAELRADRDPLDHGWVFSRSAHARAATDRVELRLANRSSYSPPTLGDQFFRDAVGVEPNPDLRPERVPSEWEAGAGARGTLGRGVEASLDVTLYRGDVRGMIVWAPDFRFIWSPRNFDVRRAGADVRAEATALARRLTFAATHTYARVAYTTQGPAKGEGWGEQVVYRPRHTSVISASWNDHPLALHLEARYTGERNTDPSGVNVLPGFWTVHARASREWRIFGWSARTSLDVDRLLDEKDTLIFGFPDPGRVLRFGVELRPAPKASTTASTRGLP